MGSYVSVLRRRLGYIVLFAAALAPLLYLLLTPDRTYASTAVVQSGTSVAAGVLGVNVPYEEPENRLATEVEVFGSTAVTERAATTLAAQGWTESPGELRGMVSMTPRGLSTLLDVRATADTPERAQAVTTAFLDAYLAERQEAQRENLDAVVEGLEQQRAEAAAALAALGDLTTAPADVQQQAAALASWTDTLDGRIQQARLRMAVDISGVTTVADAPPGEAVTGLGTAPTVAAAVLGALLAGFGLVMLIDAWGDPVRTRQEAKDLLGLPLLGELPRVGLGGYRPERDLVDPRHPVGAAARGLQLRVTGLHGAATTRTVVVAALPENATDGVHAAVALALAWGRAGMSAAVVIDAAEHGARWARALAPDGDAVDVGTNGLTAEPTGIPGVWTVPASPGDRTGLLEVSDPALALTELHELFDLVVVVDVGSGVPDAAAFGERADATLVVAVLERTPARKLESMHRTLEDFGVTVDGVVLAREWGRRAIKMGRRPGRPPKEVRGHHPASHAVAAGVGADDPSAPA